MYAVIFTAKILLLDDEYQAAAARMRERAFEKYGCITLDSVMQDNLEITISTWTSLDDIQAWKNDPEHLLAQQKGRDKWYNGYDVKVCEILRQHDIKSSA